MFISNPFYRFSVHGGAARQSSREGSCPSAELRINIIFFIFSLNTQQTSKSAFLLNEQKSIESNSTACPASRTSGAFFTPNFTHCIHIEKPDMPLHAFMFSPAFVVFRGVFLRFSCFNQNTESRQNCSYSSTTEFQAISIEFYCFAPISAVFEGFLANFIHNYNLFLTPSRSNKKPAVAAVYSGNGVPAISQNSHPQGWSRSELWETQSGSTPDRRSFAKHLTISKHETAVGYDNNGVLSDMLSTDAQHLVFQKFGRTAGFDSLSLLNLCGRRKPHSDAFKQKASDDSRERPALFKPLRVRAIAQKFSVQESGPRDYVVVVPGGWRPSRGATSLQFESAHHANFLTKNVTQNDL